MPEFDIFDPDNMTKTEIAIAKQQNDAPVFLDLTLKLAIVKQLKRIADALERP